MKTSIRKRFGMRVKELRLATGISQEAFADKCGIVRSYMSRIERGLANPSLDAIQVLADALGVEVSELFNNLPATTKRSAPKPTDAKKGVEVMVPFAKDGTCFHPGLASTRTHTYQVGKKGKEVRFDTFEAALEYLKGMGAAKWRRPNENGNWSIVSAKQWGPLPEEFKPKQD